MITPFVIYKQKQSILITLTSLLRYFVASLLRDVRQDEPAHCHAGEDGETHEGERRAQEDTARVKRGLLQGERSRWCRDPWPRQVSYEPVR